jgi:D-arabinose 1-dehydrogenase-like Zn-dependent alcohol dehydrogenase
MWAMVLEETGKDLVYKEVPDPVIQEDDDVIIKVKACGVCATDLKVMSGYIDTNGLPRILGHEPMGVVTEIGKSVKNVEIGDRVITSTYTVCKNCKFCRNARETLCENVSGRLGITHDGGFAEYFKAKAQNIVKVPDNVDDADAAVIPCGAGVPYHALVKRIKIEPVDKVVIIGVGGVGIQAVQLVKSRGAQVIAVDIDEDKLMLARENGADYTVNSLLPDYLDKMRKIGGLTVLLDTAGIPKMISECSTIMERGSKIVLVGYGPGKELRMPLELIVLSEFEILGSRGVSIQDAEDLMSLVSSGQVKPIVKKYKLTEVNEVLKKLKESTIVGRAVVIP